MVLQFHGGIWLGKKIFKGSLEEEILKKKVEKYCISGTEKKKWFPKNPKPMLISLTYCVYSRSQGF